MTPHEIASLLSDDFHGRDIAAPLRSHIENGMIEHLAKTLSHHLRPEGFIRLSNNQREIIIMTLMFAGVKLQRSDPDLQSILDIINLLVGTDKVLFVRP